MAKFLFVCFFSYLICAQIECANIEADGSCDGGLPLFEMIDILHKQWNSATSRDVKKYHSFFDPDFKLYVNGKIDTKKWHDLDFITGIFSKVNISQVNLLTPISPADRNAVITTVKWSLKDAETGYVIHQGPWSIKYTFTDNGNLIQQEMIGDEATIRERDAIIFPINFKMQERITTLFDAMSLSDLQGINRALALSFKLIRNNVPDQLWMNKYLRSVLFLSASHTITTLDFSNSANNACIVNFYYQVHVTQGGADIAYYDSWHVTFDSEGKILLIVSIMDEEALHVLLKALTPSSKPQPQYPNAQYSMQQQQQQQPQYDMQQQQQPQYDMQQQQQSQYTMYQE